MKFNNIINTINSAIYQINEIDDDNEALYFLRQAIAYLSNKQNKQSATMSEIDKAAEKAKQINKEWWNNIIKNSQAMREIGTTKTTKS